MRSINKELDFMYCKRCKRYMNPVEVVVSGQLLCGKCVDMIHELLTTRRNMLEEERLERLYHTDE